MKPFHCLRCGASITSPYGYCDICCRKKGERIRQYLPSISKEQRFTRDGRPICILCGRVCEILKTHLTKVHNIDINDYRKKYKIPKRVRLRIIVPRNYSEEHRKAHSEQMKEIQKFRKKHLTKSQNGVTIITENIKESADESSNS